MSHSVGAGPGYPRCPTTLPLAPFLAPFLALVLVFTPAMGYAEQPPEGIGAIVKFRTLHSFAFGTDRQTGGARPRGPMQASDGNFYGTSFAGGERGLGTIYRMKPRGRVVTLHSFKGSDGYFPDSSLIEASDGALYGTASSGGAFSGGTIFRMDPASAVTVFHSFSDADGVDPRVGLVQAADGDLYGTASGGGQNGKGTAFKIALDGTFTVLHDFGADEKDGATPYAALIQASDGNFYGTTYNGGRWLGGTVYRMTPQGEVTTLHAFGSSADDGVGPANPLVQGDDDRLYGTTNFGGSSDLGTAFRISLDGQLKILTSLATRPSSGLARDSDGNFYGSNFYGGVFGKGWVYRMTPAGKLTEVHSFSGADGANPSNELIQGIDGRLYGVTESGGTGDAGVIFGIQDKRPPPPTD
jgi:uncharacterized repeat protein (TIGR03803 family)